MSFDTTLVTAIAREIAKWGVPLLGAFVALFFTPLLDRIKTRLNRADLRTKQFEDFASDLSSFIFNAELMYEFRTNNWDTDVLMFDYNKAVTTFRTKEFVYLSWARRFWPTDDYAKFEAVIRAVRLIDETVHTFNDGKSSPERIASIEREIAPLRKLASSLLAPPPSSSRQNGG